MIYTSWVSTDTVRNYYNCLRYKILLTSALFRVIATIV